MVEQTYRVDMIPNGIPLVVHVSQYDTEARRLIFELYKGDVAYEVPAGAAASIAGTKPDKTAFIYPMAIDGNVVSIDLKQQMAIVAGDVLAEIQITDSTGKIGSANFVIRVERGPIDEDSVISETDLPIFEELVSNAQAAAADAQTAADTASAAASSVASIVPASAGSAGQILTRMANGADWQTLDLSGKANTSTLATVESSSTASKAYAVGDYLVYNGILYRVTAAIDSGQTLTPGTNITATNAGAELTSLNNDLTNVVKSETLTNATVYSAYGWITSSRRMLSLTIPLNISKSVSSVTFTSLLVGQRLSTGGYAFGADNTDVTSMISSAVVNGTEGLVRVVITSDSDIAPTNNICCAGTAKFTATFS